ncbi:DNA-binding death effector domain-containing protein 2 isoform X3 [Ictidomys tridecemlineatus]
MIISEGTALERDTLEEGRGGRTCASWGKEEERGDAGVIIEKVPERSKTSGCGRRPGVIGRRNPALVLSLFRIPPPGMALSGSTLAPSWEEDECLDYYGMLSLHRMFEVVGGQLTECELELLAFLLDEAPGAAGGLARARSGLELLLELERRGQCDESNLRLLGQLLRVLARQDLLPHLARKRRRPVSPERYSFGTSSSSSKRTEGNCRRRRQSSSSSDSQQGQWDTDRVLQVAQAVLKPPSASASKSLGLQAPLQPSGSVGVGAGLVVVPGGGGEGVQPPPSSSRSQPGLRQKAK